MSFKDYYKILEVSLTATQYDIKKSHRRLALKYHPDRNPGDKIAEAKFKEIQEAYEILSGITSRESFNYDYNKFYNNQNEQNKTQNHKPNKEQSGRQDAPPLTPQTLLEIFHQMHRRVVLSGNAKKLDREKFYNNLQEVLNQNCISFLLHCDDTKTNHLIVNELLKCCELIELPQVRELSIKLVNIAGSDNEVIQKIHLYVKNRSAQQTKKGIRALVLIVGAILLFLAINDPDFNNSSTSQSSSLNDNLNRPQSGDLNTNTTNSYSDTSTLNSKTQSLKPLENYSDWDEKNYETGSSPGCYNFTPRYNKSLNNRLEISVGYNTDVVLKLINIVTRKCIRYVYIRGGDIFKIRNIPEGKYYLKIAYGKDWRQKVINGKCIGKFISNALYKKGDEILDFNKVYEGIKTDGDSSYRSYQVSSYSLKLDVIATDVSDKFQTSGISEEEFNDEQ